MTIAQSGLLFRFALLDVKAVALLECLSTSKRRQIALHVQELYLCAGALSKYNCPKWLASSIINHPRQQVISSGPAWCTSCENQHGPSVLLCAAKAFYGLECLSAYLPKRGLRLLCSAGTLVLRRVLNAGSYPYIITAVVQANTGPRYASKLTQIGLE
jgi:hypothetical protein